MSIPRSPLVHFAAFAFIAFLAVQNAEAGFNRWTTRGPWAGKVTAVVAHPSDPQTAFAGLQYAGVFRTRDGGETWQPIWDGLSNLWITSLVIDPQNPATLYAGSYGDFVFKTTDGGDHWISQHVWGDPGLVNALAIDPVTPTTLYAGTLSGVWKTTDGGCSWFASATGQPSEVISLLVNPGSPDVVYAGSFSQGGYRSTDGGTTWTLVLTVASSSRVNGFAVDPFDSARVYVATDYFIDPTRETGGSVLVSEDTGASWSTAGDVPNKPFIAVSVDPFGPNVVSVAYDGGVYRSGDRGSIWAPANSGLPAAAAQSIASGPVSGRFWVGTPGSGVFRTDDGGQGWGDATSGIQGFWTTRLLIDPNANSTIWTSQTWGAGGGIFKSTDTGRSWVRSGSGLPDDAVFALALALRPGPPQILYVGLGFGGGIHRSSDGGASWSPAGTLPSGDVNGLFVPKPEPSKLYAQAGALFVSDDGGDSWTPTSADNHSVSTLLPDSEIAGTLLGTVDGELQKSTDGGSTWALANAGLEAVPPVSLAQSPADPELVLAGTAAEPLSSIAPLYRSTDRGAHWSPASGVPALRWVTSIAFDPYTPSRVYAAAFGVGPTIHDQVYRSLDGGLTWEAFDEGLPTVPLQGGGTSDLAVSANGMVLHLGTLTGVYELTRSPDAGPEVSSVAPGSGSSSGGTEVTISGSGFTGGETVSFGSSLAAGVERIDGNHLIATTTPGPGGVVDVTVTSPEPQFDTLRRAFVYDFLDVPPAAFYHFAVVDLALRGVTGGCGGGNFCPGVPVTRGQAAVQIEKALRGADYAFPPPSSVPGFPLDDVDRCSGFAPYIFQLILDNITAGCGGFDFCPQSPVTRAQMVVFLLRAAHGPSYQPTPATGTVFDDVPADAFAADYIEAAAAEGITAGCGGGNFCPEASVTRAQTAVLIDLALPAAP